VTLWLASGWLLDQYVRVVPRHRPAILAAVFVGCWGGNLAYVSERGDAFEWAAAAGVVMIAVIAWHFHTFSWTDGASPERS
jgi:hypothetical protein